MDTTLERARQLVRKLGETTSPDEYVRAVVDGIWDLLPNDETTFMESDRVTEVVYLERWRSVLPPLPSDDPFSHDDTPYCPRLPLGQASVIRMSDRMSAQQLRADPMYREMLEPLGCRYVMMVQFHQRSDVCRVLGIARSDRDFTDRELDLLILLAPHLETEYQRATIVSKLTPREREVVMLVGHGLTNRQIARHLDISPGTVRTHLEHVFSKLGVGTRTAAVAAIS